MEHDQRYSQAAPFVPHNGHWPETPGYHPHHQYEVYGPYSDTQYSSGHSVSRASHQQLQPLMVPAAWPSLLVNQTPYTPYSQASPPSSLSASALNSGPHPVPAPSPHPVSAPPLRRRHSRQHIPNPRKTLSEADRRKMCLYHEENPTKKQTEIGEMFGVERSTVSKVLRQKERYLEPSNNEDNMSPVKKPKSKFPDIERALANWIRNQEERGRKVSDETIIDQAKLFSSATPGGAEAHANVSNPKWVLEFKRRNNIGGLRSRKSSSSVKAHKSTKAPAQSASQAALSPVSMDGVTTTNGTEISTIKKSPPNIPMTTSDSYTVYQSQSNTSLSSAFDQQGTPPLTFSSHQTPGDSPFYVDMVNDDGQPTTGLMYNDHPMHSPMQRSRSQTFPVGSTSGSGGYNSPPASSQTDTPKVTPNALGIVSPTLSEMPPPAQIPSRQDQPPNHKFVYQYSTLSTSFIAQPPQRQAQPHRTSPPSNPSPLSTASISTDPTDHQTFTRTASPPAPQSHLSPPPPPPSDFHQRPPAPKYQQQQQHAPGPSPSPSQDEARAALELVMRYFRSQNRDLQVLDGGSDDGDPSAPPVPVEPAEVATINKLLEKFRMPLSVRQAGRRDLFR